MMILRPILGLGALACATPAFANTPAPDYPAAARGDGPTINGYNLSRWAEDWSIYRDPARRDLARRSAGRRLSRQLLPLCRH